MTICPRDISEQQSWLLVIEFTKHVVPLYVVKPMDKDITPTRCTMDIKLTKLNYSVLVTMVKLLPDHLNIFFDNDTHFVISF